MPERPTEDDYDETLGAGFDAECLRRGADGPGKLGEFRIIRELGRGGMGVVYEAHQESLDRHVALKVLPPALGLSDQATRRFEREARAAARLQHKNIVAIHAIGEDQGQHYYAMEMIDGVSLGHVLEELSDGKWSSSLDSAFTGERATVERSAVESQFRCGGQAWADCVSSLIAEVAEALHYAHEQGVVHRDIKPANLLLSPQGYVCIADFGLARLAQEPGMTMSGALVGTPAYMSPEQVAAGRMPLDHRTDIYSLGAVLYEMLTLERPFQGRSRDEVIGSVLTKDPAQPRRLKAAIPQDLEVICLKALEKDPDRRYQTAGEMARDLREYLARGMIAARPIGPLRRSLRLVRRHPTISTAVGMIVLLAVIAGFNLDRLERAINPGAATPQITRLAVLPFRNASENPEHEIYADGITEVLIADLGQISALKVIARRAVMQYKSSDKPISEIAEELAVDAIVEGSVMRSNDRIRVTATLIDAATENQLWGNHYQRSQKDVLLLQGEVAQAIANQIRVELTPEEQALLASNRVVDPEAHEAYLIGRSFVLKWTPDDVAKGVRYLETALEHDPEFAPAYAGLANAHVFSAALGGGWRAASEVADKARDAATMALQIDDSLAEAHAQMGAIAAMFDWDVERAEQEFRRAIQLNPNLPDVRTNYAALLSALGRHVEALDQVRMAIQLDPLNPWFRLHLARRYYSAGDFEAADAEYEQILDLDPSPFFQAGVLTFRADVWIAQGRMEEAVAAKEQSVELAGAVLPDLVSSLGYVYGLVGRREEALALVAEIDRLAQGRYISPVNYARIYAGTGDLDKAFELLERAYETRCAYLFFFPTASYFERVRSDPRGKDLLRRVGLPYPDSAEPVKS